MATLTNTKIKDTYDGLLKTTDNDVLDVSGVTLIEDGLGNASALSLGRANNGVTITGALVASGLTYPTTDGTNGQALATDGAGNLSFIDVTVTTPNLQEVTDEGATTTNAITVGGLSTTGNVTANSFIKSAGLSSQFLKADGSVDSNAYLTSESDTLDSVTGRGATTSNSITVGGITAASLAYPSADGTNGQAIVTDGAGNLSFATVTGTTPTLDQVTGAGETSSINVIINGADLGTIVSSSNTLFGDGALDSFTTGSFNTAIGYQALTAATSGSNNTVIGARALDNYTSGSTNTAIGYGALGNGTTLSYNTAIGDDALFYINGSYNVALGHNAGETRLGGGTKSAGDNNIYIGSNTVSSAADTDNEIVIGANAVGNGSNSATYGDSNITKHIFTGGSVGIGTSSPAVNLDVRGGSQAIFFGSTDGVNLGQAVANASGTTFGSRTADPVRFTTNNTERMRIDSSGNVGIGTSSPSAGAIGGKVLHLVNSGATASIRVDRSDASTSGTLSVLSGNTTNGIFSTGSKDLTISTNSTERMRIDSSGNVGIGASPSKKLTVGSDSGISVPTLRILDTATSVSNGQTIGTLDFYSSDLDGAHIGAFMSCYSDETYGRKNGLIFGVSKTNTADATEAMRITSGGDVLIGGQNDPDGTSNYGAGFVADSFGRRTLKTAVSDAGTRSLILFYNPNGNVGSITTSGSSTAYNTSSDYRLKENVVPMEGALDRVDALKPSRFNFIADPEKTVDGFLAHEVAEVIPEAISGEKDAVDEEGNPVYQGIDQSKIVPLLVGAIKELSAKVAALESQLNA